MSNSILSPTTSQVNFFKWNNNDAVVRMLDEWLAQEKITIVALGLGWAVFDASEDAYNPVIADIRITRDDAYRVALDLVLEGLAFGLMDGEE